MKFRRQIFLLLLILISSTLSQGQQVNPQASEQMSEADRARFEKLRGEGFEALYNLDYEGARKKFQEIATAFPTHPGGAQFLAATLWAETLNQSRRLQSSLYSSDSFFESSEDKPNPKTVEQFRALTRQAAQAAKARLRRNKQDAEALYYLGATEGLKAAFETGVERRFMAALSDGSSSVDRHRKLLKLNPDFRDAELTIGLYDYIVGGLPLPVKVLASIAGARGSKRRGLEAIQRVAREGSLARDDAKALLIVLFKREKRYADALALSRELSERYPRNYLFKLETADALITQAAIEREVNHAEAVTGAEREAFGIFESLLIDRSARDTTLQRAQDLIHYRYGQALLTAGQFEHAAKEFLAAANTQGAEKSLATMAHLSAAQAYDLAGKRKEALAQYNAVLNRPDESGSHEDAKRGLREPYKLKSKEKKVSE